MPDREFWLVSVETRPFYPTDSPSLIERHTYTIDKHPADYMNTLRETDEMHSHVILFAIPITEAQANRCICV